MHAMAIFTGGATGDGRLEYGQYIGGVCKHPNPATGATGAITVTNGVFNEPRRNQ